MPLNWTSPPSTAFEDQAVAYATALHAGVFAIAQRRAPEIENWMRENAPWTDRTSNARQGLWTDVKAVVNQMVELALSHGVDYGIFLEVKNSGRYAVIAPALDHWTPIIWADVQRMLS